MKNAFLRFACLAALGVNGWVRAADIQVGDSINPANPTGLTGDVTWTANNTYHLNGYIYVLSGSTLTIEPGTVIKGNDGVIGTFGSLYICRGAKIFAKGTVDKPIIFTAEEDNLANNLSLSTSAKWGGVVILGNAVLNKSVNAAGDVALPRYDVYEGLNDTTIGGTQIHRFGGSNDADNSGIMRYCSIRHGGKALSANKEINGLSLGAVGSGTVIEYIEVVASADDGYEFFGGTVNTKYLISALNEDDSFDTDQDFRGKNQFWFSIQKPSNNTALRDRAGELNGWPNGGTGNPAGAFSKFTVYNATLLGGGKNAGGANNNVFNIRDAASPKFFNCIFADFASGGVSIAANSDPFVTTPNGDLVIDNSLFWDIASVAVESGLNLLNAGEFFDSPNVGFQNDLANPGFVSISRAEASLGLDPRPTAAIATTNTKPIPNDGFYDTTANYKGAFGNGQHWADGWTTISKRGLLAVNKINSKVSFAGGNVTVTWNSAVGASYKVEGSTDMITWTDLATVAGTGGNLSHSAALSAGVRFLRVSK